MSNYFTAAGVLVFSLLFVNTKFGILGIITAILMCLLQWLQGAKYSGITRLDGKIAVVTGANVGIGKMAAMDLARRGAKVILACRDQGRAEAAREEILKETGVKADMVTFMKLDLASFQSVRQFASELSRSFTHVDILINNAGAAFFKSRLLTVDGQEMVMQVNHFGNFLLTNLLSDMLSRSKNARVIMTSSLAHGWAKNGIQFDDITWENTKYEGIKAMSEVYGQSKLANILFAKEFGRRFKDAGIQTFAVHPGAVMTEFGRNFKERMPAFIQPITDYLASLVLKTPEMGAQTLIYCAVDPGVGEETGLYYAECRVKTPAPLALSQTQAEKLWDVSKNIVGDLTPV